MDLFWHHAGRACYLGGMSETFLGGRITLSSLAAPTVEDVEILKALSEEDRRALLLEALERGRASGLSGRTPEEIWEAAKARARALTDNPDYAA